MRTWLARQLRGIFRRERRWIADAEERERHTELVRSRLPDRLGWRARREASDDPPEDG